MLNQVVNGLTVKLSFLRGKVLALAVCVSIIVGEGLLYQINSHTYNVGAMTLFHSRGTKRWYVSSGSHHPIHPHLPVFVSLSLKHMWYVFRKESHT